MQTTLEETIYADLKKYVQFEVSQLTAILGGSLASCVQQQQAFPNHSPVCIY